jgi:hypothetical protein
MGQYAMVLNPGFSRIFFGFLAVMNLGAIFSYSIDRKKFARRLSPLGRVK